MSKHKCPYCERELESVIYTDWGRKVWNDLEEKWEADADYGELEYRCPHCGASIEYTHLEEMGVV